ncbi:cation diffusion facilitator family transporter [Candidatus Bathyarchaeota archaeon]|nr:cation diffusion facilitator family transporter [Candidatus Bathyarchaeota archaeon]
MEKTKIALITLIAAILIFGIKLIAYFISNSVALLSDALESIINIVASGLMFFSVCISNRAPDSEHKYGHQKIEDLTSMIEGLLILAAAILIITTAIGHLFEPSELLKLDWAIAISIIATLINASLSWLLIKTSKDCESPALEGDAKHLFSDVISSIVVWLGLIVTQITGLIFIDSLLAFLVAILIIRIGIDLCIKSSNRLMDQSCKEEEKRIMKVLQRHTFRFIDFHDLKTRRNGNQIFAEMHLSVDGSLSVKGAHDLTEHLEQELMKEQPNIQLTIHIEPGPHE